MRLNDFHIPPSDLDFCSFDHKIAVPVTCDLGNICCKFERFLFRVNSLRRRNLASDNFINALGFARYEPLARRQHSTVVLSSVKTT